MKKILYPFLLFTFILPIDSWAQIPSITNISPLNGPIGSSVEITGTNFSTTTSDNKITFDGIDATVTEASVNSLTVTVPAGASYNTIQLTIGTFVTSSIQAFNVTTPSCSTPTFANLYGYFTGLNTFSVKAGDFNKDNKHDLVTANNHSNSVSVLLGVGDGTFETRVDYATGLNPIMASIGDFNGDHKEDLAISNNGDNTVSILLGTGDGTFSTKVDYPTGPHPWSMNIGDLNGDGQQDLITVNNGSNTISVLLGNGDGTFGTKTDYTISSHAHQYTNSYSIAAVSDFNGDGKQDLAVASYNTNRIAVLLGNGDGTLGNAVLYSTGVGPQSLGIGDFNKDGFPDLAVVYYYYNSSLFSVLLNKGDGTFDTRNDYEQGSFATSYSTSVGDFNGDNNLDLAIANESDNVISIFLGTGNGDFGNKTDYPAGLYPVYVTTGDFNGDGMHDLASASHQDSRVSILLSTCDPISTGIKNSTDHTTPMIIYPNPATAGHFTIRTQEKGDYKLINEFGQTVQNITLNGDNEYSVHIEDLSSGVYYLVGLNDHKMKVQKIMVTN